MAQAFQGSTKDLAKTSMGKAAEVEALIAPTLEAMGYDLVRIVLSGRDQPVLQIMAERRSDGGMSVDNCAEVSRAVAAILDVEDPIPSAYTLEVSSPGLDRPLTRLADFERFAGLEAKVELTAAIDGRRRFAGRLRGVTEESVLIQCDEGEVSLPFLDIAKAKLKLTDELIAASEALKQSNVIDD